MTGKAGSKVKKTQKIYFPREIEDFITQYNNSDDEIERNRIYKDHLEYPFDKLAENIINTFNFPYVNYSFDDLKRQVVSFLVINLYKYSKDKGKAFSYFSVIAKNHLIHQNNKGYKQEKRDVDISSSLTLEEALEIESPDERMHDDVIEFTQLLIEYWNTNIPKIFKKQRDIKIAYSVVELFKKSNTIESYNKKALYILIREMTDCKTSYITKVINKMKSITAKLSSEFYTHGSVGKYERYGSI